MNSHVVKASLLGASMLTTAVSGVSAAEYSSAEKIMVTLPVPPASATALAMHVVFEHMSKTLGQSIIVEARPSYMGEVGTRAIALDKADGNHFGVCIDGSVALVPAAKEKTNLAVPYTPSSFSAIGMALQPAFILIAHKDLGVTTADELLEFGKQNPEKLKGGAGLPSATMGFALLNKKDANINVAVYKSTSDALPNFRSKDINVLISTLFDAKSLLEDGVGVAIGMFGDKRSTLQNTPTLVEQGYPEFGGIMGQTWSALCAPADVSSARIAQLNNALNLALANKQVQADIAVFGAVPYPSTPKETQEQFQKQYEGMKKLLEETGVQIYGSATPKVTP